MPPPTEAEASGERSLALSFSCELPTQRVEQQEEFVSAEAIAEVAAAAERAGFAAVNVTDHPAGDARWLDAGGHHALDPFVALSFAAAATSRVRLLTNVYIAAYRNPFLGAKAALSLDVLSGGRLILGTAAGYLKPEFAALGVDFDERAELLDEALEVMKLAWTGEDVAYEGRHFHARGVRLRPAPVSKPHPPIWIGGNTKVAIHRAVASAQGWAPFASSGYAKASRTASIDSIEDLTARIEIARSMAEDIGRTEPFDICFSGGQVLDAATSVEQRRDLLGQLADVGVTWIVVGIPGDHRRELIEGIDRFASDFI